MSDGPLPLPVLPHVPELSWRPLTPADLDPWHALITRLQDADRNNERWTHSDLERSMGLSWVDLDADAIVGIDADGVFRAFGRNVFRPGGTDDLCVSLLGGVDPAWRGRGIGRQVLAWQRARALHNVAELRASGGSPRSRSSRRRGCSRPPALYRGAGSMSCAVR